ncbi:MAG: hypothetical protein RBT67_03165 [Thauera sp.]|nr:hypothetical protein [Thauera sp.]
MLRGTDKFDEQFSAYLTAGYVGNSGNAAYSVSAGSAGAAPAPGNAQLGTIAGVRYRF